MQAGVIQQTRTNDEAWSGAVSRCRCRRISARPTVRRPPETDESTGNSSESTTTPPLSQPCTQHRTVACQTADAAAGCVGPTLRPLTNTHCTQYICPINLSNAVALGGPYDGGWTSPVGLQGHVFWLFAPYFLLVPWVGCWPSICMHISHFCPELSHFSGWKCQVRSSL